MKLCFWKMSGTGNDFVVIDNRDRKIRSVTPRWVQKLCDRHNGIGADGILFLEKSRRTDFRMVYYNADGSRASLCGNGARCIARFAVLKGAARSRMRFETDSGVVTAEVNQANVRLGLVPPRHYRSDLTIRAEGQTFVVSILDTGVPHAVCLMPSVSKVDVAFYGKSIRFHPAFRPAGVNVNFVQRLDSSTLRVRTYERGVEAETLACGTGATASAIVAALKGLVTSPVSCLTQGGETLQVHLEMNNGDREQPVKQVLLEGPVRVVFKGEIDV